MGDRCRVSMSTVPAMVGGRNTTSKTEKAGELRFSGLRRSEMATQVRTLYRMNTSHSGVRQARRCWRWESNPQELSLNRVRTCCVYQFRHASTRPAANCYKSEDLKRCNRTRCRAAAQTKGFSEGKRNQNDATGRGRLRDVREEQSSGRARRRLSRARCRSDRRGPS